MLITVPAQFICATLSLIHISLAAVLAKLADLESELATIKANQLSGDQKVQVSGTFTELFGAHLSDRPPANSVSVGATFMVVGDTVVYQSNGSDWVVTPNEYN